MKKYIKSNSVLSKRGRSRFIKPSTDSRSDSDSLWQLDVEDESDVKSEVLKALDSGATLHDVEDYLYELYSLKIISEDEFSDYYLWAKRKISNLE